MSLMQERIASLQAVVKHRANWLQQSYDNNTGDARSRLWRAQGIAAAIATLCHLGGMRDPGAIKLPTPRRLSRVIRAYK